MDDIGGVIHDGEAMGDKDDGAIGKMLFEVLKQFFFGFDVEGRRGFIEQEDLAGVENGTGDGDSLRLAFGETSTLFGTPGVKTLGKVEDEVGEREVEGFVHGFEGGFGVAHEEVFANGAREEGVALGNVGNVTAEGRGERMKLFLSVMRGMAWAVIGTGLGVAVESGVGFCFTLCGGDEGKHEADEGGFACTCGAEDSGEGARAEIVGEVLDDGATLGVIAERDVLEA